jgi:hypothetical protein
MNSTLRGANTGPALPSLSGSDTAGDTDAWSAALNYATGWSRDVPLDHAAQLQRLHFLRATPRQYNLDIASITYAEETPNVGQVKS